MSDARGAILNSIRRSLGRGPLGSDCEAAQRLSSPSRNLMPERARRPFPERLALFEEMALLQTATIDHITIWEDVPSAVDRYLKDRSLEKRVAISNDDRLMSLAWKKAGIEVSAGPSNGGDLVGVTPVFAAIAETGTLCVVTAPDRPYTLSMLPDHHIAILRTSQIVAGYEDCWDWIRKTYGVGCLPRTVLWITGTSLTGDIEQTLQRGAHGPRKVHIILLEDGASDGE